jgi:hypothetical protein
VNGNTVEPIQVGYLLNHMPKVWFKKNNATVKTNNFVDLEFYLGTASGSPITGHDATVYIKTTGGQLNKTQVRTINGEGKVRLFTNYLEDGDDVTVSCGFQYYSGTDDCAVTITTKVPNTDNDTVVYIQPTIAVNKIKVKLDKKVAVIDNVQVPGQSTVINS